MSKYTKKLGSDKTYKRPKTTFQENLTANEIAEKLQGYEKVDNIEDVPLNTHIRYFTTKSDGTQVFRLGGFLFNKQNPEKYVMLNNGKNTWSVQVKGTVFFKKLSHKDELEAIHSLYKKKLAEKDLIIEKLKKYIKTKIGSYDPNLLRATAPINPNFNKMAMYNKNPLPMVNKNINKNTNKNIPTKQSSKSLPSKNISARSRAISKTKNRKSHSKTGK